MIRLLTLALLGLSTSLPAADGSSAGLIDDGTYADDAAVQKSWVAGEGSTKASLKMIDGKPALAFPCTFAGTQLGRGVWDRKVSLDLNEAQGVELDVLCANSGPISSFSFYLQSGDGWYHGTFSPRYAEGWNRITLAKSEMKEDGKPKSWGEITKLRIAAWRGDDTDTEFFVRNIRTVGVLGADARVLVLEGGHGPDVPENERQNVPSYAARITKLLHAQGIRNATIHDDQATLETLKKAAVVVLPYNPGLPQSTLTMLIQYLQEGGKVISFYTLPSALAEAGGMKPGKWMKPENSGHLARIRPVEGGLDGMPAETRQASWALSNATPIEGRSKVVACWFDEAGHDTGLNAVVASSNMIYMTHVALDDDPAGHSRLLMAMLGHLDPKVWADAVEGQREKLGHMGNLRTIEQVYEHLSKAASNTEVKARVDEVKSLIRQSAKLAEENHHAAAFDALSKAESLLREAYCIAEPAKEGEFRAFWCHSAYGVKGLTWDESISRLKANGFTAIMPNMLWGGVAYYPSEILPVAPGVAEHGDQIAECVAACKKHGLQIHVWKVDWNTGHEVPKSFTDKLRAEGRLQLSWDGIEQPWLCPSNPENLKMERDSLLEVARRYPVDGIHFDYIRYPGPDHCFCAPCRERFEKATGQPVAQWPGDVRNKGARREEWIKWCQANITVLVESTSTEVRKVRPGIKVSAAVFRNWAVDSRVVMQDWKLWCERGYLDFVCPMDYTTNNGTYDTWVRNQKTWAGPAELVPGVGASSTNVSQTADQVIGQINITRKHGTKGFIIFNYGEKEARDLLPLLGLGVTKK